MKAVVVGAGRMGLPLACVVAKNGADVTACDVDKNLVAMLNTGCCPYDEPGLKEMLSEIHAAGRFRATSNTAEATSEAEVVIIIVPAHLTADREIDYSILRAASAEVGKRLERNTLVCFETTVSVRGTRLNLIPVLEQYSGLKAGQDFQVAFSPERVKANLVLSRLQDTEKVVGGFDELSRKKAVDFYHTYLGAPVTDVGSLEAAELTKLVGMLYRDVNIALANELASFSESIGVDFESIRQIANRDGEANLLMPGIGVGGHCTPVYPYFLTRESRRLGITQHLAESAREINDAQPKRHVDRLAREWQPLEGKRIHVLGLGFRPNVKVDTFSPAYVLRAELEKQRAQVTIEDPCYTDDEIVKAGFTPAHAGATPLDAVILNTAHREFLDADFAQWYASGIQAVVDGRDIWDPQTVVKAGLLYLGIGRAFARPVRG